MLVRVVRTVIGAILLVLGIPLALAGGGLWFAMQQQSAGGGFTAPVAPVATHGHAVVVSDIDALLRREAPFAREERTTLRLTARTADGRPAFVGLAPAADVARYLRGVPHTSVTEVRLARGPLPVDAVAVGGTAVPAGLPAAQQFWAASSTTGSLEWSPHQWRGEQMGLVLMGLDAAAPVSVETTAVVRPGWLASTTYGLLTLGGLLVAAAVAVLVWPPRPRDLVYVVPPDELSQVAATLGVPLPREAGGDPAGAPPPALDNGSSPSVVRQDAAHSATGGVVGGAPTVGDPAQSAPAGLADDPFRWPPVAAGCRTATPVSVPPAPAVGGWPTGTGPLAWPLPPGHRQPGVPAAPVAPPPADDVAPAGEVAPSAAPDVAPRPRA